MSEHADARYDVNEQLVVDAIGEPIVAGAPVMPSRFGMTSAITTAGAVTGGVAGMATAGKINAKRGTPSTPGGHQGNMYMAVGESQVAFFELKRGLLRSSLGKLLLKVPRTSVSRSAFAPSRMGASSLELELADGTVFPLDVARVHRSKGLMVHELLNDG